MLPGVFTALLAAGQAGLVSVIWHGAAPAEDQIVCTVANESMAGGRRTIRPRLRGLMWECVEGLRLSCDAPGWEPIDLDDTHCRGRAQISWSGASNITLVFDDARPVSVEWREETAAGTRLLARRDFQPTGQVSVPVATRDRVLRINRPGSAPLSIFLAWSNRLPRFRVPPVTAGGEVFGWLVPRNVLPLHFILRSEGSASELPIAQDRHFGESGILRAGLYEVVPVYRGGLEGPAVNVEIRPGETAEVAPFLLAEVGGVELSADVELGEFEDSILEIRRVLADDSGRSLTYESVFRSRLTPFSRQWRLDGLLPGHYEAIVSRDKSDATETTTLFEVAADAITEASFQKPTIVVEGRVTLGGRPASQGLLLMFYRDSKSWSARTDESGTFRVELGEVGNYDVQLKTLRYLSSVSRRVTFSQPLNRFDFDVPGGIIHVKVRTADGSAINEPVQVHLRGESSSQAGFVTPQEGFQFEFIGLTNGRYKLSAETKSSAVTREPAAVTLSDSRPVASVELVLDKLIGTLSLVDIAGTPVTDASVWASVRRVEEQPESPGSYRVEAVSPGTPLLISAAGRLPVCRVLKADDFPTFSVTMTPVGQETAFIQLSPSVSRPIGEVIGLPSSDCAVPAANFNVDVRQQDSTSILMIKGLAPGVYQYRPTQRLPYKSLTVPGPVVTFTRP